MTSEELIEKLKYIQKYKCETSTLELKSAEKGCPTHLYDTLSSFSNQDDGGIIIFGIDEKQDFKEVGVYDSQDIQKKINEQCLQMQPIVRPLLTVIEKENKFFVSAEIPGADIYDRPVYYKGKGVVKGSYIRVGDSDEPMTEYEVYSYEAYRKKYQDDVRVVDRVTFASLDYNLLSNYIQLLKQGKPRLAAISDEDIYELMSIKRDNKITLSSVMNFSLYPQAYFPQLCIISTVVPGNEIGEVGDMGERFLDNLLKNNKLIIKQVNGIENLNKVKTGALITCNHFNPFDCFTVEKVFRMSENEKDKRLYKVIREGNYTNFPGLYGFFFRNCDTLPLSSNKRTMVNFMKAVDTILQKGDYILIYPEQSMWWNYRKPKSLKNGAFKLAARNNVPVIPIFITMEDSKLIGEDGFNIQEYTINVEEPIYPDEKLTEKENTEIMKQKNFEIWKNVYEKFYGIPLEYTCEKNNNK